MFLVSFSCSKDNSSNNDNNTASYRAYINGELWEASVYEETNGLIQLVSNNEQIFQLTASSNGIKLSVYITATELSNCMAVGSYDFPNRIDISYQNEYGGWIGGHLYDIDNDGNPVMTLNVTSCNNNVISGTFTGSYTGNSGPGTPTNVIITDGVFENIEFDIIQI